MSKQKLIVFFSLSFGFYLLAITFFWVPSIAQESEKSPRDSLNSELRSDHLNSPRFSGSSADGKTAIKPELDAISSELDVATTLLFYPQVSDNLEPNQSFREDPMAVADFNNDGLKDLLYQVDGNLKLYYQQSAGEFTTAEQLSATYEPWDTGDFNNDQLTDFVMISKDPTLLGYQFFLQNDAGSFDIQSIPFTVQEYPSFSDNKLFYVLDLNDDGYDDIARLIGPFDANWIYLLSDGEGGYLPEVEGGLIFSQSYIRANDTIGLDPDKPLGIIYGWDVYEDIGEFDPIKIFNIAIDQYVGGVFTNTHLIRLELDQMDTSETLEVLDINHDGLDDILLDVYFSELSEQTGHYDQRSQIAIWTQTDDHQFTGPTYIDGAGPRIQAIGQGDVNLDGIDDLVTLSGDSYPGSLLSFFMFDGSGSVEKRIDRLSYGLQSDDWFFVEDLNGDTRPDILSGRAVYYHNGQIVQTYLPNQLFNFINYRDVFDDFSDSNSGWPIFHGENTIYTYADGEYLINSPNADFFGLATPSFPAYEYVLKVNGRKSSGPEGGFGVAIEMNNDLSYFKGFLIFPSYGVVWLVDINEEGRLQLLEERTGLPRNSTGNYEFEVDRRGSYVSYHVRELDGDTLVTFSSRYDESSGWQSNPHRIGLITLPLDNGFEARFDDFFVDSYRHR